MLFLASSGSHFISEKNRQFLIPIPLPRISHVPPLHQMAAIQTKDRYLHISVVSTRSPVKIGIICHARGGGGPTHTSIVISQGFCFRGREMQSSISRKSALRKKTWAEIWVYCCHLFSLARPFLGKYSQAGGRGNQTVSNPEIPCTGAENIFKNVRKLNRVGVKNAIQKGPNM